MWLRCRLNFVPKTSRSRYSTSQSGLCEEAAQTGRCVADSCLDCRCDPSSRRTVHTLAEGRGNGCRFSSTGPDGDGENGTNDLGNTVPQSMREHSERLFWRYLIC